MVSPTTPFIGFHENFFVFTSYLSSINDQLSRLRIRPNELFRRFT